VPAGAALSTAKMKSAVFDPRVTAIAVVGRDRSVAVAAALDPQRPFKAPVLARAVVDPGVAGSLAVLFPPASGTIPAISLQQNRSGELVSIDVVATAVPGADGAILVQLKGRDRITGPQLGYGIAYTLKIGTSRSFRVRTRPVPAVLSSRSFVSGPGFTGTDRRDFLKAVNLLPAEGRKIVDVIGGVITVRVLANSAPICDVQTSCAGFDPGNGYFLILNRAQLHSASGRFVITHELGHLVDFLGLDSFSHQEFLSLFSHSLKWKSCFPVGGRARPSWRCSPTSSPSSRRTHTASSRATTTTGSPRAGPSAGRCSRSGRSGRRRTATRSPASARWRRGSKTHCTAARMRSRSPAHAGVGCAGAMSRNRR
jgi:hypothetical protein